MSKRAAKSELVRTESGTLHGQLFVALRDRILSGEYSPGEKIPTEAQLVEQYGVSRMTVRRAVDDLRREGLVDRRPALGTFVRESALDAKISGIHSLTDEIVHLGMKPGSRLLEQAIEPASTDVAAQLEVAVGSEILRLERVRTANDRPFYVAKSYINISRFDQLRQMPYDSPDLSLLDTYRRVLKLEPVRMTQLLSATGASPVVAREFGIRLGAPVLRFERTVYLDGGIPVEHVDACFRGDSYKFYTELS